MPVSCRSRTREINLRCSIDVLNDQQNRLVEICNIIRLCCMNLVIKKPTLNIRSLRYVPYGLLRTLEVYRNRLDCVTQF